MSRFSHIFPPLLFVSAQRNHILACVHACDDRSLVGFLPEIENEDPSLVVLCEDGSLYK